MDNTGIGELRPKLRCTLPMDASSPPAPPRRRFSLLLGPWHTSTRVAAGMVLLFLVFCNLPGQLVTRLRVGGFYPSVGDILRETRFEHGWPLTFLARPDTAIDIYGSGRTIRDCFEFWSQIDEFRLGALLVNGCVVPLISLVCGIAIEAWRRKRQRLWQFHVRDLLAGMIAISLVGAWYVHRQRRYAAEQAIAHPPANGQFGSAYLSCDDQEGGIMWLRMSLGDEPFQFLDRVNSVTVWSSEGWSQIPVFSGVQEVGAVGRVTSDELTNLERLPRLRALSLEEFHSEENTHRAELPALTRLQGLKLAHVGYVCRGIDRLCSLEVLSIYSSNIDDQSLYEIAKLPKLRELAIYNSPVGARGLESLSALPELEALAVERATLDEESLQIVGRLRHLKVLRLTGCEFRGGDLRRMATLHGLEVLDLSDCDVTGRDLSPLVELTHLREMYLWGAKIRGDATNQLRQFKHLRVLTVPRVGFSNDERRVLREALPDCDIYFLD